MFCNQCGNQLPEGSDYCNSCGSKVGSPGPPVGDPVVSRRRSPLFIRLLKWTGIGIGGLLVLIIILGIVFPSPEDAAEVDTRTTPAPNTPENTPTPEIVHDINIRAMLDLFSAMK